MDPILREKYEFFNVDILIEAITMLKWNNFKYVIRRVKGLNSL